MALSDSIRQPILVSACLLGLQCRYDGRSKRNQAVLNHLNDNHLLAIPVCPEQLAGMPTPREATRFLRGDGMAVLDGTGQVISASGTSMNQVFCKGAEEVLKVAQLCACTQALLKERSPSCGAHQIYRGESVVDGVGVTAARLLRAGLTVISEEDILNI